LNIEERILKMEDRRWKIDGRWKIEDGKLMEDGRLKMKIEE